MNLRRHLLSILFTIVSTFAFSVPLSFSFAPYFSYGNGTTLELLYLNEQEVENPMTSELIWPQENLLIAGLKMNADINTFVINLDANGAFPKSSGQMQDSDWFDQTFIKQGYSQSENYLYSCFNASVILEKLFQISDSIAAISPAIGFQYKYLDTWALEGGKGWYDWAALNGLPHSEIIAWDSDKATCIDPIPQVDYRRHSFITWIGGAVQVSPWTRVHAKFTGLISPFVYVSSQDHHYYEFKEDILDPNTTGRFFNDKMKGYFRAFDLSLDINIDLTKHMSLYTGIDYFCLNNIKGKTYTSDNSTALGAYCINNSSGTRQDQFSASIGAKMTFSRH